MNQSGNNIISQTVANNETAAISGSTVQTSNSASTSKQSSNVSKEQI